MSNLFKIGQYLTWLDIERRFKSISKNYTNYPKGVESIRCFPDGAEIEYTNLENLKEWLEQSFSNAFTINKDGITLTIGNLHYPLEYIESENSIECPSIQYPLWKDQVYNDSSINKPVGRLNELSITAFHSFKGGVGRTTSMMSYVAGMLDHSKNKAVKILLVDADLEAPGITLWLDEENKPSVSYIQFLEALHYPPSEVDDTINYFAGELKKTSLNVQGIDRELFILPASHELTDVMDMPVLPEHLARNPDNPNQLTDHICALGKALGVDWVFIDLRAGLSEISSPLLFDPRVEHFFVTTVAPQSMRGTAAVLNQIYQLQKNLNEEDFRLAKPSIILGPLTPQLREQKDYSIALETLNNAFPSNEEEMLSEAFDLIEVEFEPRFMSIGSVRGSLEILKNSSLYNQAKQWADSKFKVDKKNGEDVIDDATSTRLQSDSERLHSLCEDLQFAEVSAGDELLVTEPLRNLAKNFTNELPNAVSIGAKGAGKTFTYLQLCRNKNWNNFLVEVGVESEGMQNAHIHPLLWSENIENDSLRYKDEARKLSLDALSGSDFTDVVYSKLISEALKDQDTDWDAFWEGFIVRDLGYDPEDFTLDSLNKKFNEEDKSVVLMVDGIEDIFDVPDENGPAIKSLLKFPNRIRELRNRRIGFICFVRADYVQSAIKQNVSQYQSRFNAFKLEWTPETFLRLIYWICAKANLIGADSNRGYRMDVNELLVALEDLWGKKLGRNGSKEAMTARWVFSALCDLNGKLQARDIVRFLKFTAKNNQAAKTDRWTDRVLTPEAIRRSLPECSNEKVQEASQEISALNIWMDMLKSKDSDLLKSPFNSDALGLEGQLLSSLKELGIVYEDTDRSNKPDRFYLPEIYRSGLQFTPAAGGRPRVQALLKRNLGGMPF